MSQRGLAIADDGDEVIDDEDGEGEVGVEEEAGLPTEPPEERPDPLNAKEPDDKILAKIEAENDHELALSSGAGGKRAISLYLGDLRTTSLFTPEEERDQGRIIFELAQLRAKIVAEIQGLQGAPKRSKKLQNQLENKEGKLV